MESSSYENAYDIMGSSISLKFALQKLPTFLVGNMIEEHKSCLFYGMHCEKDLLFVSEIMSIYRYFLN